MLIALARLALLMVIVAAGMFALLKSSPIDPVDAYLGPAMATASPEQKAQIAAAWGLDRPAPQQFLHWAGNIARGNLGHSTTFDAPVAQVLQSRLGASALLAGSAWLLSGALGFALGLIAAAHQDRWPDRAIRVYCYLLASTPTFWLAILLLTVFSVRLGWTPVCCAGPIGTPPDQVTALQRLHHLALPLIALTLFGVAQIALHTRARLAEVLRSDYVTFSRAQGATRFDITLRHGVRNSALPALTALFASIGEIFGGSILAEQVFAWPGLGRATVQGAMQGDIPLLLAIALLTTLVVAAGNLLADRIALRIDPRMRP